MDPFETQPSDVDFAPMALGGYRLLRQLGRGGMGIVYEAEPIAGGPLVALKTLQRSAASSLASLKDEFRKIHDLAHPNLVRLGELDTTDRIPFFTMEIVRGRPFDECVQNSFESAAVGTPLPFGEEILRDALCQLAEGLNALHEAGIIHRDIKPSNVLMTPQGRVVILDMGLAIACDTAFDRNAAIAGTPYYMAPEQAQGRVVSNAADWYAVGVMLYEILTGERAFQSKNFDAILKEKLSPTLPAPRDVLRSIPGDLNDLCCGLLNPSPSERPDGRAVLQRLVGTARSSLGATLWIGRDQELEQLRHLWRTVTEGTPQVAFVAGRSGMGKTAVVDQFLSELRRQESVVVLRGRCYENEAVSYRGFDSIVDALAAYLRRLPTNQVERVLPIEIEMLCQLFPVMGEIPNAAQQGLRQQAHHGDPRERRQRGIGALRELLCRLGRYVPLVVFIDDLQQGDDETAAVFRELFRRGEAPLALFLGTYRSEDSELNPCLRQIRASQQPKESPLWIDQTEISIDTLNHGESVRLASGLLLRHGIDRTYEAEQIAREAAGDPLFLRMLAEHRIRQQDSSNDAGGNTEGGWTLSAVIEGNIRSLSSQERLAMELLASAGRPLEARDLELLTGDAVGLIRSLRVRRLVRRLGDHQRVEPFHDKIREAVQSLVADEQLASHCRLIANHLDQASKKRDVEFLADLYRRSGDRQKAGPYYEAAAEIADSTFAFFRAIQCYRYAIELLKPSGDHEVKLRKGLGDALANASRSSEAAEEYLKAASVAVAEQRAELQQLAALRYLTSGHVAEGVGALRSALAYHRLPWPGGRVTAVVGLLGRASYLRIVGLRARTGTSPGTRQRERLNACWAAAAGMSLVDPLRGSFYIAETLRQSLRIGSNETLPRDLAAYMGQVAIGGTRSRKMTHRVLAASRALALKSADPYTKSMQFLSRGIAALLRGQWGACLHCCDIAIDYLSDPSCHGKTWESNTARTFALWALQYQGNVKELSQRQPELHRIAKETDDRYATLNFGTQVMAHVQLANDQPLESLRRLEEEEALLSHRGFFIQHHNHLLARTYTHLYMGRTQEAYDFIADQWSKYQREFLSYIQQVRIDHHQVLIRTLIANASDGHQSAMHLRRAHRLIHSLRRERAPWATALAQAFQAGCDRLENKSESLDSLRDAVNQLQRVGMHLFASAASFHVSQATGQGLEAANETWKCEEVVCGERMAHMLIPGFNKS